MSKAFLSNPIKGNPSFGTVPKAKCRGDSIPGGEILLRWGRHKGPNKGYGAVHIWNEHKGEMRLLGFRQAQDVPEFVSRIVKKGVPLHYEGGHLRRMRLKCVQASIGSAVLEFRDDRDEPYWGIVTAYPGTKTHGPRVGTVR